MAKQEKLQNLLTELHEAMGDAEPSVAQMDLLDSVKRHAHAEGEPEVPEPDLLDALEYWVEEQREEHPRTASVVDQIIKTLVDIGV